jgi:hypothetical protein
LIRVNTLARTMSATLRVARAAAACMRRAGLHAVDVPVIVIRPR